MLNLRLKGGALYIAIIISILVSIILSLFIVVAYFNLRTTTNQILKSQLQQSLQSGFEISASEYFNKALNNRWQKLPYGNDSVKIKKLTWGCYKLICVQAKNAHQSLSKSGLFAQSSTPDTALIVANNNRQIGLAGKIELFGNCYLPEAGIKSAYIDGSTFYDIKKIQPYIRKAPAQIPNINSDFLKDIVSLQTELNPFTDSLISTIPEQLANTFNKKTCVYNATNVTLNNQILSGNIKIIASDKITVTEFAQLNQVLLIANTVVFERNFKGSVHVIAKEIIQAEENCEFNYPSSFCVFNNKITEKNSILNLSVSFEKNCKFKGSIIVTHESPGLKKAHIKFNQNCELIGDAYSKDYADIQGHMYGTIVCNSLVVQTPSAVYENHLYNTLINPKKYGKSIATAIWFNKLTANSCAKWLN